MAKAFLITSIALVQEQESVRNENQKGTMSVWRFNLLHPEKEHLLLISDRHGNDLADFASLAHLDCLFDRNLIEWVHGLLLSFQFYTCAGCIDAHFEGVVQASLHTYKSLHSVCLCSLYKLNY